MVKFASDEVAAIAKDPSAAEALVARERLDEAFAAQDIETVSALCAGDSVVVWVASTKCCSRRPAARSSRGLVAF